MKKLSLNHKAIIKGLKFYNINDSFYLEKCLDCCNYLQKNKQAKINFETVYNLLYNNLQSSYRPLLKKKSKEELFGENYHSFTTNLILLLGYAIHKKNIKNKKIDKVLANNLISRVKQSLTNDIYNRNLDEIRVSQMLWGAYLINIKIIEIGRLQYEHYKDSKDEYIKIHIPPGDKMTYNALLQSLKQSKEYVKKYFKIDCCDYYCNSWLLSKQISTLLDENANINQFQSLFEIKEGPNCIKDILNYVYQKNEIDDYKNLDELTSLQKSVKRYLLNGNAINIGIGKLKKEHLK